MALDYAIEIQPTSRAWPDTLVFKGYAAPVRIEAEVRDLEVVGVIPQELDGAYVRNSADHQYPPKFANDLFLNGDGMLHKVRIANGHADLSTRYVRTEKFQLERAARRALFGAYRNMFTDDPSVKGKDRGTANTSVVFHAGKLLALKEAARPVLVDHKTLETIGTYDFNGTLSSETFTAHPKLDPRTGEMVANGYFTSGVADDIIKLFYVDSYGKLTRTEDFQAPYPSMVHDCFLSENYVIFVICPMTCDWERVTKGEAFFHWDDRLPTKIGVVPRKLRGTKEVRWFTAPKAVLETHTFNAWEEGSKLHLEHFITQTGWLSQFPDINNPTGREQPPFAYRWTLDMGSNDEGYASEKMFSHVGEMPMIDLRFLGRKTRHFWFGTSNTELGPMLAFGPKGPPFTCLGHFDAVTGKLKYYYSGPDSSPEEPVFIPRPGSAHEGDGWIITVVGRRSENRTDLVILNALKLDEGPVATIKFPCRIHEGFHGIWIPGAAFVESR